MNRHTNTSYAVSAFLVVTGAVLAIAAAAITVRTLLAPPTQTWSAWTAGTTLALSVVAVVLWMAGALLARRVHRRRRDRVGTFLTRDEREHVTGAVARFEAMTSGEIRVHLSERTVDDPTRAAVQVFERTGMTRTRDRNGVLFFVSVRDRRFAVIGDTGIHAQVSDDFWAGVARTVETAFAEGRYADGLVDGIALAGARLAEHFPPRTDDTNELPDTLTDDSS